MYSIKEMFEEILSEQNSEATILEIFKTGSQIFRDNPGDLDYVAVCENYKPVYSRKHKKIDGKTYDLLIKDEREIIKSLNCNPEDGDYGFASTILYNYFIPLRKIIYGKWEYEWNMLDFKDKYIYYLKTQYSKTTGKRMTRHKITKGWVHYYVILKIYENNKVEITDKMKENISKLYNATDGSQIPIIDWIEEQLNAIE